MNNRDKEAFDKITEVYNQYGGEGNDILYQYMLHHMNNNIYHYEHQYEIH